MTGSSAMGPLRVSLVGLTTTQQQQQPPLQHQQLQPLHPTRSLDAPTMPIQRERQRVSRNLFGSIAPGESDRLLEAENQRLRQKFCKRYSFDIATGEPLRTAVDRKDSNQCTTTLATNSADSDDVTPTEGHSMNLLEREQAVHLNSLKFDKYVENLLITPPQSCAGSRRCVLTQGLMKPQHKPSDGRTPPTASTHIVTSSLLSCERHKPYARQLKLTECFNQRKPVKCHRHEGPSALRSNGVGGRVVDSGSAGNDDALANEDQSTLAVLTRRVNSCQAPEVVENDQDLTSLVTRVQAEAADANDDEFDDKQAQPNCEEETPEPQHVEVAITATASSSSASAPSSSHLCAQQRQQPAQVTQA